VGLGEPAGQAGRGAKVPSGLVGGPGGGLRNLIYIRLI
jgi:hypothetical protein